MSPQQNSWTAWMGAMGEEERLRLDARKYSLVADGISRRLWVAEELVPLTRRGHVAKRVYSLFTPFRFAALSLTLGFAMVAVLWVPGVSDAWVAPLFLAVVVLRNADRIAALIGGYVHLPVSYAAAIGALKVAIGNEPGASSDPLVRAEFHRICYIATEIATERGPTPCFGGPELEKLDDEVLIPAAKLAQYLNVPVLGASAP